MRPSSARQVALAALVASLLAGLAACADGESTAGGGATTGTNTGTGAGTSSGTATGSATSSGTSTGTGAGTGTGSCSYPDEPELVRQVAVLVFDPILEVAGGERLSAHFGWGNSESLAAELVDWWWCTSEGRVRFEIAETWLRDEFPVKQDGFRYDDASYLAMWADPSTAHVPDGVDYLQVLEDLAVCDLANAGQIDELWMFGAPYFGFYESRLAGPGGYWYNSPPLAGSTCARLLAVMGFNYERGLNEMIHDFGHRTESTMTYVYGDWEQDRLSHAWDRFGLTEGLSPSYGFSGCGSIHWPPTATGDYDYTNAREVQSMCDDFLAYPALTEPAADALAPMTCEAWGCTERGFYEWWFRHLPHVAGADPEGRSHDWWRYAMDPQAAVGAASGELPCPQYGTLAECDAHADRCAWYLCADICLPQGTDPAAVCTCEAFATLDGCNATTASCSWYACVDFCLPTGTDVAAICGP